MSRADYLKRAVSVAMSVLCLQVARGNFEKNIAPSPTGIEQAIDYLCHRAKAIGENYKRLSRFDNFGTGHAQVYGVIWRR